MASVLPCKDCISGTIHKGQPLGTDTKLFGRSVYISPVPERPKGTIVYITDIFGWTLPNARLLADAYAKEGGFKVIVPDFFPFQPIPLSSIDAFAPVNETAVPSFLTGLSQKLSAYPPIIWFLYRARASVTTKLIAKFLEDLKSSEPDLSIFTVGFCWGGRYSLIMGTDKVKKGTVNAVAAMHPSLMSIPSDIEGTIVPVSVGAGTNDTLTPASFMKKLEELYLKQAVELEIKSYEDMIHGFAVRGDIEKEDVAKAMQDAQKQVLDWFTKHL
ncbi:dienelactone hydrolase [Lipomyces chichibuensis]|uniref:dienelactone hydrolase n=1 Tax=Lipomyces chichibuensis TaxID=1546026 RepID=UPI0033435BD7